MGSIKSKHTSYSADDITSMEDFCNFSKRLETVLTETVNFIARSTPSVQNAQSRVFHLDSRLGIIANLATRLRELDQDHPNNTKLIRLFDRILSIMWSALARRYMGTPLPGSTRGPSHIKQPAFLIDPWPEGQFPNAMLRDIVLVVEMLMQSAASLMSCSDAEVTQLQSRDNSNSILQLIKHTIDGIRSTINTRTSVAYFGTSAMAGVDDCIELLLMGCEQCVDDIQRINVAQIRSSNALSEQPVNAKPKSPKRKGGLSTYVGPGAIRQSHSMPDVREKTTSESPQLASQLPSTTASVGSLHRALLRTTSVPVNGPSRTVGDAPPSFIKVNVNGGSTLSTERPKKTSSSRFPLLPSVGAVAVIIPPVLEHTQNAMEDKAPGAIVAVAPQPAPLPVGETATASPGGTDSAMNLAREFLEEHGLLDMTGEGKKEEPPVEQKAPLVGEGTPRPENR